MTEHDRDRIGVWITSLRVLAEQSDAPDVVDDLRRFAVTQRMDAFRITVVGRQGSNKADLIGRWTDPAVSSPDGAAELEFVDTPFLDCPVDRHAEQAELIRTSDVLFLVVSAASSLNATDLDFLDREVLHGGHVPVVAVVITGVAGLSTAEASRVVRYVRRIAINLSDTVTVIADTEIHDADPRGRVRELVSQVDRDAARHRQRAAQLRDIAVRLASIIEQRALDAEQRAVEEETRLANAVQHAEKMLDVNAVRRDLERRRAAAIDTAVGDLTRRRTELAVELGRLLRGSTGSADDVARVMSEFQRLAEQALQAAQSTFQAAVLSDAEWLDGRLREYLDVLREQRVPVTAEPALGLPGFTPSATAERKQRLLRRIATPAGAVARLGAEFVLDLLNDYADSSKTGFRKKAIKVVHARRDSASRSMGDIVEGAIYRWSEHREKKDRIAGARADADGADRALRAAGDHLTARTNELYGALFDDFDTVRRTWRQKRAEEVQKEIVAAGAEWRDRSSRVRALVQEIETDHDA